MSRYDDLNRHLTAWRARPFLIGRSDCGIFVAEWLEQQGFVGVKEKFCETVKYDTWLGALRVLERRGGYQAVVEEFLGPVHDVVTQSGAVGDVVLFENLNGAETLGLLGRWLIYAPGVEGLLATDCSRAVALWRLDECPR